MQKSTMIVEFHGTQYPAKIDEDGQTCLLLSENSITPVPLFECQIIAQNTNSEQEKRVTKKPKET